MSGRIKNLCFLRKRYLKRIFSVYFLDYKTSNICFWYLPIGLNQNKLDYLGGYYFDFREKVKYPAALDKKEVLLIDYKGELGQRYNPDAIAQYGLGCLQLYKDIVDNNLKEKFFAQADWFVNNLKNNDRDIYLWEFDFDLEGPANYKKISRASAMSQGLGLSLLLRAYHYSQEKKYLEVAQKAFPAFYYDITKGGLQFKDKDGFIWLEEVITLPCRHILNGFIWALFGIYDYFLFLHDEKAKQLFEDGIKTIERYIKEYDIGFWSKYDRVKGNVASIYYHKMHIYQLQVLYDLTHKQIFKEYADKWEAYLGNKFYISFACLKKAIFKLIWF